MILNKWKVFYLDDEYTYIILADYLPNTAIDTTKDCFRKISKEGYYAINASEDAGITGLERRDYLINTLKESSNWEELLTGKLNGVREISLTSTDDVFAKGSPDIELWQKSWNTKYPADRLYLKHEYNLVDEGITYDGWYIGLSENPDTTIIRLSDKQGYNDTLYYPYKNLVDSKTCRGYWLTSPSAFGYNIVTLVGYQSGIGGDNRVSTFRAARPIIRFPNSILYQ